MQGKRHLVLLIFTEISNKTLKPVRRWCDVVQSVLTSIQFMQNIIVPENKYFLTRTSTWILY